MEHLNELILLLPDYELEGYPRQLQDDDAGRLLSGWIALWHPILLCGVGQIPRWQTATRLPSDLAAKLFVLPPISSDALESGAPDRIREAGGLLLEPMPSWRAFQSTVLGHLPQLQSNALADELVDQFAALGYAYLQVQLMTRKLRYSSNLDLHDFEEQLMRACESVLNGDRPQAENLLQACFDTLGQERDHYYSNDVHLIDLTLVAETTIGRSLERQLDDPQITTIVAAVELLKKLRDRSPVAFDKFQQRICDHTLCYAGGPGWGDVSGLLPLETAERRLQDTASYRDLQIERPRAFAQLNYGLWPEAVPLLAAADYLGVLLIPFTGGRYPTGSQPKVSWESHDGSRISALIASPLDSTAPSTYVAFGVLIGEALDRHTVPTLVLAHWPGGTCEFYELLKIIAKRTPALGKWTLVDDYFSNTDVPYHQHRYDASQFNFDWLGEAKDAGELISSVKASNELASQARSLQNLANLVWQLRRLKDKPDWFTNDAGELTPPDYQHVSAPEFDAKLNEFLRGLDHLSPGSNVVDQCQALKELAQKLSSEYLSQLAILLARSTPVQSGDAAIDRPGRLAVNPRSNPVRQAIHLETNQSLDETQPWHFASGLKVRAQDCQNRVAYADITTMGFVASPIKASPPARPEKIHLADAKGFLRNEFTEAQIDPKRGHLVSLRVPAVRGNRLSAMVVYREKVGSKVLYSEIVARQVSLVASSSMSGAIRATGNLVFRGKSIGGYEIDYEIARGSRIVVANIKLSNLVYPIPIRRNVQPTLDSDRLSPWESAFVLRFAWPTEAANLRCYSNGQPTPWTTTRVFAPELIEIDEVSHCTQLLTGGLAFHARQDSRFAETILAAPGQAHAEHRIGFALDLPYPLSSARQFMDQVYDIPISGIDRSASGWLVHVDAKNVIVDLESPLVDIHGQNVGMRVSVSEVAGKATTANVRWFRTVGQAIQVQPMSTEPVSLSVSDDQVAIPLRAGERTRIDVLWQR